jgi:hypothetical protein
MVPMMRDAISAGIIPLRDSDMLFFAVVTWRGEDEAQMPT